MVKRDEEPQAGIYYSRPFQTGLGTTKGGPVSPTIFNIVANVVVHLTLREVFGPQEALHGLIWAAGGNEVVLFAYDGDIAVRTPSWCSRR